MKVTFCMIITIILMGCHSAPKKLDSISEVLKESDKYWSWHNVPHLRKQGLTKVAIIEFNVEFVTLKIETMFKSQAVFDPFELTPFGQGLQMVGVGKKAVQFSADLKHRLCEEIYKMFITELESRDFEIVPEKSVTKSFSYNKFNTKAKTDSTWVDLLNPIASDTGRVKKYEVVPQLKIITGSQSGENIETVETQILQELEADISVRAHFRVGVYHDYASLEKDSVISIVGKNFVGNVSSNKSLLSRKKITEGSVIDSDKYITEVKNIFPFYINLATTAVRDTE